MRIFTALDIPEEIRTRLTEFTERARALAPDAGRAPGALIVRSDEIRKRLFGLHPRQRLKPEAYCAAANVATNCSTVVQRVATQSAFCFSPGLSAGVTLPPSTELIAGDQFSRTFAVDAMWVRARLDVGV